MNWFSRTAQQSRGRRRKGNIIVLSAAVLSMALGFAAFSIDIGFIALSRGQLQSAVDAAALAATMELKSNADQAVVETNVKDAAVEVAGLNKVGPFSGLLIDPDVDIELGRRDWDPVTSAFVSSFGPTAVPYNIVRISGRLDHVWGGVDKGMEDRRLPLFFAPAIGSEKAVMKVTSVATYQPRDIMLVLDYSGSMNDDTEFKSVSSLAQQTIEDAITTMWNELGNPSYGSMPFTPDYLTVNLPSTGMDVPDIDVTYRGNSVVVTSTMQLDRVKLGIDGGGHDDFNHLSGMSGTFSATGGGRIDHVHVWSGDASDERVDFDDEAIEEWLGLDAVSYPHASGSWLDFINYVNTDYDVYSASFKFKYSTMCLINYWNERKPKNSQTSTLWQITTQPLTAAKNASDALIDYIKDVEAEDQIGLSIYSHPGVNGAILESGLTFNLDSLKPLYRDRQAGHYDNMTNIGAGLLVARQELEANSRPSSVRVIVLITDGVANRPSSNPVGHALNQASLCDAADIRIMTVSLGLGADQNLMQNIADATGGEHFNVPGGGTIEQYEQQLMDVFRTIAADRPLKLLPVE